MTHPRDTRERVRDAQANAATNPVAPEAEIASYFDELFAARRTLEFELKKDQFFPMGDNSPASKDARIWGDNHYVDRKFLIGKALFVYWPHHLKSPLPFTPDFSRMRFVR
jgi:hypothetical protein